MAVRRSRSLQHVDLRCNTVRRSGACALLDVIDEIAADRAAAASAAARGAVGATPAPAAALARGAPSESSVRGSSLGELKERLAARRGRGRGAARGGRGRERNRTHPSALLTFNGLSVQQLAMLPRRGGAFHALRNGTHTGSGSARSMAMPQPAEHWRTKGSQSASASASAGEAKKKPKPRAFGQSPQRPARVHTYRTRGRLL